MNEQNFNIKMKIKKDENKIKLITIFKNTDKIINYLQKKCIIENLETYPLSNDYLISCKKQDNEKIKTITVTMFTLHAHSNYSFLTGTIPYDRLIDIASENGSSYVALTDTDRMNGLIQFAKMANLEMKENLASKSLRSNASCKAT